MQSSKMFTVKSIAVLFGLLCCVAFATAAEARVFNTEHGRWTIRDPLGYVDGMNAYEYASTEPLTTTDPSGTIAMEPDCHATLMNCLSDPIVGLALEYMSSSCQRVWFGGTEPICSSWVIRCMTQEQLGASVGARVCCLDCSIQLGPLADCGAIAHELIHAGDFCKFGRCAPGDDFQGKEDECGTFPGTHPHGIDCNAMVCSEARAWHYTCIAWERSGKVRYEICMKDAKDRYGRRYDDCVNFDHIWNACLRGLPDKDSLDEPIPIFPPPRWDNEPIARASTSQSI